jgi:hypothetical protein
MITSENTTAATGMKKPSAKSQEPARVTPAAPNSLEVDGRPGNDVMAHIQFRIPQSKLDEFNQLVLANYGMKHGGKTKTFIDMIDNFMKE